jgi:hypothetical protein
MKARMYFEVKHGLADISILSRAMIYFDSDMSKEYKYGSILSLEEGNLYLRLWTMSPTIYGAKFKQTIIHQHVHLRRESQSHSSAHVLMRLYPIDKLLVFYKAKEGRHARIHCHSLYIRVIWSFPVSCYNIWTGSLLRE